MAFRMLEIGGCLASRGSTPSHVHSSRSGIQTKRSPSVLRPACFFTSGQSTNASGNTLAHTASLSTYLKLRMNIFAHRSRRLRVSTENFLPDASMLSVRSASDIPRNTEQQFRV